MPEALARTTVRLLTVAAAICALAAGGTSALGAQDDGQAHREAEFARRMTGARLVGHYSISGAAGEQGPRADSYSVSELTRGDQPDTWIFRYTMSYGGGNKLTVPIPVRVVWAGDTPVLTMTEQTVEGLGTFTVRVLLYGDRYAGTWQNGPFGGSMWGSIERPATAADEDGK